MKKRRVVNGRPGFVIGFTIPLILVISVVAQRSEGQEMKYDFPYNRTGAPLVYPGNLSENGGTVFITETSAGGYAGDVVARKITSMGTGAPLPNKSGFRILSDRDANTIKTVQTVAMVGEIAE